MTEGLAVLAAVLLVVASVALWRRWGWPGVVALWSGAVGLVASVAALLRRPPPRAPSTPPDVHRARADVAARRQEAQEAVEEAQEAQEVATARRVALEAEGGPDELVAEGIRRSMGES